MREQSTRNHEPGQPATWPAGRAPVAVVMISLNEAHNMEAVLDNLAGWAQEVFLVDSYSADDTVDIALRHGVQVVQRRFRGFGDQWNFALEELPISAPWTMKLDPDERLDETLKRAITDFAHKPAQASAASLTRRLWFMGKPLPVRQRLLRVWRSGACRFSDVAVNEYPQVAGKSIELRGELQHHDSPDLAHWLAKQNQYTTAEAISQFEGHELAAAPRLFGTRTERRMWLKRHFWKLPGRYTLLFFHHWLVLGAWRAGRVGRIWAHLRCEVYRLWEYKSLELRWKGRLPDTVATGTGEPDARVRQYD